MHQGDHPWRGKQRTASNPSKSASWVQNVASCLRAVACDLLGQLIDTRRQLGIGGQGREHAHEGTDDQYADFGGPLRPQDVRQHQAAMFGEGHGRLVSSLGIPGTGCKL